MTRKELLERLERWVPSTLSCDWDNDGAMLCTQWEKEVKRVVVCLDVTKECISYALDLGADLIISHHPFLFRPLSRLAAGEGKTDELLCLIRREVAVFSFHTRLDAADGGLNDRLARLLSLENVDKVSLPEDGVPLARIGELPTCDPQSFARGVSRALGSPVKLFSGRKNVRRVLICCGGGRDFLPMAKELGADAFVSGDLHYNSALDASQACVTVVDAGHRATELPVCELLRETLLEMDPSLDVIRFLNAEECWVQP